MLIKDSNENIIAQISVQVNFSFKNVKPYLENEGTEFIKDVLGKGLYEALDSAYSEEEMDKKYEVLLPFVQRPLVYYAYLTYLPFGDVLISDAGIGVSKGENTAPASFARVERLKDSLKQIAYDSREKLIRFLFANADTYDWQESRGFSKFIGGFLLWSEMLNNSCNANISSEIFWNFRSSRSMIEEGELKNILGDDLYTEILNEVKNNVFNDEDVYDFEESPSDDPGEEESTKNDKILPFIRKAVANLSVAHAIKSHRIKIDDLGINEMFLGSRGQETVKVSEKARNEVVRTAVIQFENDGNMYLKKLIDYLNDNYDDYPLYVVTESEEEEDTDSETEKKYLSFL